MPDFVNKTLQQKASENNIVEFFRVLVSLSREPSPRCANPDLHLDLLVDTYTAQLWNCKRLICPEAASQSQDENQTDHDVLLGQLWCWTTRCSSFYHFQSREVVRCVLLDEVVGSTYLHLANNKTRLSINWMNSLNLSFFAPSVDVNLTNVSSQ